MNNKTVYLLMYSERNYDEYYDSVEGIYTYEGMKKKLEEFALLWRRIDDNSLLSDKECANRYMKQVGYWFDDREVVD